MDILLIETTVSFKTEGVRASYPDLFFSVARKDYLGLNIVLKVKKAILSARLAYFSK